MKHPSYRLTAALAANLFPASAKAALVSYLSLDNSTGLTLNSGAAEMARIFRSFGFSEPGAMITWSKFT